MTSILECIRTVGRGERGRKPLTFQQANQVMNEYLNGEVDDDQMAMLLMLIRVQNETHDEVAGFVKAFQSRMPTINADIDWPCYAGKRKSAGKPWHIIAAKLLAEDGYRVLLHGYIDIESDREHVEHYLNQLKIRSADTAEQAQHELTQHNIVYLSLKNFAPKVVEMLEWKNRYGLRTPINTVVRALNPGSAKYGIRGSFHPGFQQLHAEIEQSVGKSSHAVLSFKGQSGESEYNPKVSQTVWLSDKGGVSSHYWDACMESNIKLPDQCPLGTDEKDFNMMANSVVSTMAAVLFTELKDREQSYQKALMLWNNWVG